MQKWQEKRRQKNHDLKIIHARPSIQRYSRSRQKGLNSSRSKGNQKKKLPINPLSQILKLFQMEKYLPLLQQYGFPERLTKRNSLTYLDEMVDRVDEEDQQNFLALLNTLTTFSQDICKPDRTPQNINKSRKNVLPPPSTSSQSKQTPYSIQKSEKTTSKFRIKNNKHPIHHSTNSNQHIHQIYGPQQASSIKPQKKNVDRERSLGHRKSRKTDSRGMASDDLSLIHDFKTVKSGEIKPISETNIIIRKLLEKLHVQNPEQAQKNTIQEIKLQMGKIKEMYLSYDNATLTSNITNIDLSQTIECLAIEIVSLIEGGKFLQVAAKNEQKIKSLIRESILMVKQESKESKTQNQEGIKDALTKMQEPRQPQPQFMQERVHTDSSSQIFSDQSRGEDDNFSGSAYMESVIKDFNCFDNKFTDSFYALTPKKSDVQNFIELIMMAGKMEKEIPIIAFVYIRRILQKVTGSRITQKNWRNIVLITMIEGSKVWDDQSLENHSFAKVIKPYTTLEINRLEKYLLFFIDYKITINQKQYAESYFQLRKHKQEANETANLMKLSLQTIRKLQKGTKDTETKRKQFYRKCMKKSF